MNFLILFSFLLVAFGQPALVPGLGILASAFGFALFWKGLENFSSPFRRFFVSVGWFAAVQAIQLQWMASTHYMGFLILVIYVALLIGMGLQFGLLSFFFEPKKPFRFTAVFGIAGMWTLLEWSRLFLLTGFSFNPVGLSLTDTIAVQFASMGGIFFLSFWVILINLIGYNALTTRSPKEGIYWALLVLAPYLYGWLQPQWVTEKKSEELKIALVQTALLPEQRSYTRVSPEAYIHPVEQWKRIWKLIPTDVDLLVLPESAFPYGASQTFITHERGRLAWIEQFGDEKALPPLEARFAASFWEKGKVVWKVNQSYFAQALANQLNAHLIVGLDDEDQEGIYNAAFHFQPQKSPNRYEKRILVPVSEYLPLSNIDLLSVFYAKEYDIFESCTPGSEVKIFSASIPIGPSICYEETFSHAMRDLRRNGAELFVNVTNDAWYPRTILPEQHFHHARVRAAENGVFLIRSCNTGVTGVVDNFGKPLATLPVSEKEAAVLRLNLVVSSHATLYTFWGNSAVLMLSGVSVILSGVAVQLSKKKNKDNDSRGEPKDPTA